MITNKFIVDPANSKIAASNLAPLEIKQLFSVEPSLNNSIFSVAALENLPNPANNVGRLVYVTTLNKYYFSNGVQWDENYSSEEFSSGQIYGWGMDALLGTGTGSYDIRNSPVSAAGGITNWSQVSAGYNHSFGVTADGIAYGWGSNSYGQLGTGTTSYISASPVTVIGGITNWSQVSASPFERGSTLGVTTDGIAYGWGRNNYGNLGDGTQTQKLSPVTVIGGITNWSQVSASQHSLGVTADGIAYAWGYNSYGQLGDGTTIARSSPVSVIGGITNWSQVSGGGGHSLGLTADGIAYAWGANRYGQLGNGLSSGSTVSPVSVVGGITNWAQVSAGAKHSLGVTADGIAYAWGSNDYTGSLGNGLTSGSTGSPVSVVGGITNWTQVSAGSAHSLGATADGIAYAWGSNYQGRLGDGTTTARSSPVTVVGGLTNWSQVSAGRQHSHGINSIQRGF